MARLCSDAAEVKKEKKSRKQKLAPTANGAVPLEAPATAATAPELNGTLDKKATKKKKKQKTEAAAAAAAEPVTDPAAEPPPTANAPLAEEPEVAEADQPVADVAPDEQNGGAEDGSRHQRAPGSGRAFQRVKAEEWLNKKVGCLACNLP